MIANLLLLYKHPRDHYQTCRGVLAGFSGIARPEIWGFRIFKFFQFLGHLSLGFRRPRSASAERSGDRLGKKRPYVRSESPK